MAITTISVRGDREYTRRVKILATQSGKKVADLVREALDAQFGDALSKIPLDSASFFASAGLYLDHLVHEETDQA